MVETEFPAVRLIVSESNEGFSAACNKGIMASSGDYILILNPDTVVIAMHPAGHSRSCAAILRQGLQAQE